MRGVLLAKRSTHRLPIALALAIGLGSLLPPAHAALAPMDWSRLETLIERRAYRVAREELTGDLAALLGEDRHRGSYYLGMVERRLGDAPAAQVRLQAIPTHSLWYPRAQKELAALHRAAGDDAKADALLMALQGMLTGPERDALRLELADAYFERTRYAAALELYRGVFDEGAGAGEREHAAFAIGWCYERLANPARAIWSWREAVRLFPRSAQVVPARLMLSNQYLKLGKPLLASDELMALAKDSTDPELVARAQFLAGEGYAMAGNWRMARSTYALVKPGTRWSEPAEYAEAYARWQLGDAKGAKPLLDRWLGKYPKSIARPAVLYALGRVSLELASPDQARAAFEKAADTTPNQYAELALFGLADLDYNDKRYQACADNARKLLKAYPNSAQRGPTRWLLAESLLALKRYGEAIAVYSDMAKSEGDLSFLEGKGDAVTFRLGLAHFRTGDFPSAASFLKDVVDSRYGEDALYWLAEATYRTGDYQGAVNHYARFLKAHPGSGLAAEAAYGQGYAAYQLQRYDQSLRSFKQAAGGLKGAMRQDALLRLGALQLHQHDWAGANATYDQLYSSQLDAEALPDVLYGLAYANFRMGASAEAARWAATFHERFAAHAKINRVRSIAGQAHFRLGKFTEAVSHFEAILTDDKATPEERSDAEARIGAAYYNAGLLEKAIAAYESIYTDTKRSEADRAELAHPLTQAKLAKGDFDGAMEIAVRQATGSIWAGDALYRIAQGYLDKKRPSEAVKALSTIDSPTLDQRYLLSVAYRSAGETEAGLSTLDSIARIPGPRQVDWLAELAERYLEVGNPGQAKDVYALLAKQSPKHPALLKGSIAIAAAYAKNGKDDLALTAYEELAKRLGGTGEVAMAAYLRMGQIELKRGNFTEAAVAYRQAEKASKAGTLSAVQARYWLGYTLVAARRYEDAANELAKLKVPANVGPEWQALAWLKQGEAYEHLRRWKDATRIYQLLAGNAKLPAAERGEARERLKWIDQNVNRR